MSGPPPAEGGPELRGPWNSDENFEYVSDREEQLALDGDDGGASVQLDAAEAEAVKQAALRTSSDPDSDPVTGAELGMGEPVTAGAGDTTAGSAKAKRTKGAKAAPKA